METFEIPRRFRGPDRAANGGYTAGLVAGQATGPTRVRLKAPAPMDVPLRREQTEAGHSLWHGDVLIAESAAAALKISDDEIPTPASVDGGRPALLPELHPFPACFVCGHEREHGDGLCIFPSVVGSDGVVATSWTPPGTEGPVDPKLLWAALDCPGAWAYCADGELTPMVLGQLTVDHRAELRVGQPTTVVGWRRGAEGRKHFAGTAIWAGETLIAVGEAVWITVDAATWARIR